MLVTIKAVRPIPARICLAKLAVEFPVVLELAAVVLFPITEIRFRVTGTEKVIVSAKELAAEAFP